MQKVSDYIVDFLIRNKVTHAFGMSGGAAVHLFDSIDKRKEMDIISMTHEQCAAISADGYSRATGKMGVAITTSGPGATNLLTGVCCSFYDSIPTLMLTGQVATHRLKGKRKVRQVGFQETDVIDIYKSVTKYIFQINDPTKIRYHLEKAFHIAFEGRPGPVLLDIPDDIQREMIDVNELIGFDAEELYSKNNISNKFSDLIHQINNSKRPVIILGGGLKTPKIDNYIELLERLNIPILLTWAGVDLIPKNHNLNFGTFGVYGPRLGNYIVQNSDLVISVGTRLSQNLTGGILSSFARDAKICMIDIDDGEIKKFDGYGLNVFLGINSSAKDFFNQLNLLKNNITYNNYSPWKKIINEWKLKLPNDFEPVYKNGKIDIYKFIDTFSKYSNENEIIYVDTGGNLTWTCNKIEIKSSQQLFSAWNNTPMGYSLPAAIGASFSNIKNNVSCIIGDGGLMICLAELATVSKNKLPIKIFLVNNKGHGIQKQTIETWLNGNYVCVHGESGLAFPNDYKMIAKSFNLNYVRIDDMKKVDGNVKEIFNKNEPVLVDLIIREDQKLYPVLKFGQALEDQLPKIPDDLIDDMMIIEKFNKDKLNKTDINQSKPGW